MNIENIKQSGFQLGLEAELSVQYRILGDNITKSRDGERARWKEALKATENCADLLKELVQLHEKPTEAPTSKG